MDILNLARLLVSTEFVELGNELFITHYNSFPMIAEKEARRNFCNSLFSAILDLIATEGSDFYNVFTFGGHIYFLFIPRPEQQFFFYKALQKHGAHKADIYKKLTKDGKRNYFIIKYNDRVFYAFYKDRKKNTFLDLYTSPSERLNAKLQEYEAETKE